MDKLIDHIIDLAGGPTAIAEACNVTPAAVSQWRKRGLPWTEWTGDTNYTEVIIRMAKENGHEFTVEQILKRGD